MNTKRTRILLIEDDPGYTIFVMAQFASESAWHLRCASTLAEGLAVLKTEPVDIIVTDLGLPDSGGYETFSQVFRQADGLPVVVLTGADDEGLGLRAVADGAQDFLVKTEMHGKKLARSINYALKRSRAGHEAFAGYRPQGKVLGFIGVKGGVGATTVALNVAAALSKRNQEVIAVEMRPDFGTFSMHLPWMLGPNLGSLIASSPDEVNPQRLRASLSEISHGFHILCGPQQPEDFRDIEEHATGIIGQLSRMAGYVVVDIPRGPSAATLAVLRQCDVITLVVDRELSSLKSVGPMFRFLEASSVHTANVGIVLVNRTSLDVPVPMAKVMSLANCDLLGVIPPAAQLCALCLESQTVMVSLRPDDVVTASFTELAHRLAALSVMTALHAQA